MARLIRLNEVRYVDDELKIATLLEEGFEMVEYKPMEDEQPKDDLYKDMKKDELLTLATERGLAVDETLTIAEIKALLIEADANE